MFSVTEELLPFPSELTDSFPLGAAAGSGFSGEYFPIIWLILIVINLPLSSLPSSAFACCCLQISKRSFSLRMSLSALCLLFQSSYLLRVTQNMIFPVFLEFLRNIHFPFIGWMKLCTQSRSFSPVALSKRHWDVPTDAPLEFLVKSWNRMAHLSIHEIRKCVHLEVKKKNQLQLSFHENSPHSLVLWHQ